MKVWLKKTIPFLALLALISCTQGGGGGDMGFGPGQALDGFEGGDLGGNSAAPGIDDPGVDDPGGVINNCDPEYYYVNDEGECIPRHDTQVLPPPLPTPTPTSDPTDTIQAPSAQGESEDDEDDDEAILFWID